MGWEQLPALCIYLTPPPFNSSVYPLEKKCLLLLLFYPQKPLLLVSLWQPADARCASCSCSQGQPPERERTFFYKDVQDFQLQKPVDVFLSLKCEETSANYSNCDLNLLDKTLHTSPKYKTFKMRFSGENLYICPQKLVMTAQTWKPKCVAGLFMKFVIMETSAETDLKQLRLVISTGFFDGRKKIYH